MNAARAAARGVARLPAIDEGEPPGGLRAFLALMRPTPGRAANTLLLLAQVTLTLVIGEIFRFPQIAVFVWIAFFLSGNDTASSLTMAGLSGGMILAGTGIVILSMTFMLSDAGLRLPLQAFATLAAGYLSQAMVMGALANVLLFWIVYMSMNADVLEQVGFSIDATVGNTTDSAIPDAAFLPPEEALVHVLLWTGLVFALALGIIIVANLLFGRDPAHVLRQGLAVRLRAVAAALEHACTPGAPQTQHVLGLARDGVAGLRKLHALALKLHRKPRRARIGLALIRDVGRLVMVATSWSRLHDVHDDGALLAPAARIARDLADAIEASGGRDEAAVTAILGRIDLGTLDGLGPACAGDLARHPLSIELVRTLKIITALLARDEQRTTGLLPEVKARPSTLFKPDALTNPAYLHQAVRVGVAVAVSYGIERLTDWPGIGTCVVTCFLVLLGTVGDTLQKMTLRLTGALAGAAFGIGAILLAMPYMTDLGDLLLLVLPVAGLAAWIKSGSDRIAYAGVQMAFAFFLTVLQDYGPTLDMETGRNRVLGILIGNVVAYLAASTLWPISVMSVARTHLVRAVQILGKLVVFERQDPEILIDPAQEDLREAFGQAIASVRDTIVNDGFENDRISTRRRPRAIDARLLTELQMLSVPVAIITDIQTPQTSEARRQAQAMQAWFERLAAWIGQGGDVHTLLDSLPEVPDLPGDPGRTFWFGVLDARIRGILGDVAPAPRPSSIDRKISYAPL